MQITLSDVLALHKKYAPSDIVFELVYTHCQIIHDIAIQLLETSGLDLDRELIESGSLLHDIGVHPLLDAAGRIRVGMNYITHGIEGEAILKAENMPAKIWHIAAHHTGMGLSGEDIISQKLPLPIKDYLAESDEELLIMYADKFHSKTTPPYFNSYEWYRNDVAKFGNDKVEKFDEMKAKFGIPELGLLSEKYAFTIR